MIIDERNMSLLTFALAIRDIEKGDVKTDN